MFSLALIQHLVNIKFYLSTIKKYKSNKQKITIYKYLQKCTESVRGCKCSVLLSALIQHLVNIKHNISPAPLWHSSQEISHCLAKSATLVAGVLHQLFLKVHAAFVQLRHLLY